MSEQRWKLKSESLEAEVKRLQSIVDTLKAEMG